MSLFGGAECSTASNPLSQFTKHASEDRTLQHRNNVQGIRGQMNVRDEIAMNQQDQEHMDRFFNQQHQFNHHDSFNFQNLSRDLPLAHQSAPQQQIQPSNWSQEFNPGISSNASWSSEFHQKSSPSPVTSAPSPVVNSASYSSMSSNPLMRSRIGGFSPMYNSSMRQNHIQPIQTDNKVVEIAQEKWEDKFKQLDEQFKSQSEGNKSKGKEPEQEEEEIIIDDKYKTDFEEIWNSMKNDDLDFEEAPNQWEKDFETYAQTRRNFGQYNFEKTNQFLNHPDAYEIGLALMENGAKLSEAALAFEAAIQENPNHVEAWLKLGEVQTQNEKEIAGLTALEKCLQLEPNNLPALMTLAVSYINEGYDNAAFATLERWIETKYPQTTSEARLQNPAISDEDRFSLHKRVIELFIKAAQLSPSGANMDADVQMGLGVLFYANEEFDKTIDCFKAALSVRPTDELLWNRLGASLANSNRPEEAIEAYHEALRLKPSFVRARYNLGVSSINIGCYKEAAEHLLGALSMHNVEGIDPNELHNYPALANQSTSILETLKRSFLAMDRRDLLERVSPGMDINQFRQEFNF
ncbi:hypothetical protein WICMUC_003334 [Wickerhamomyces mucosus]|uniref:Peroxisomal targeting signal receptor n=1 Tax=Wickerhamomyces mucosus TaxID=1378264 RepID=A0A9P8TDP1_9ASCO|nr:hypothetical protein WICMUC_003334 [Wickerhamomyces mucosus]